MTISLRQALIWGWLTVSGAALSGCTQVDDHYRVLPLTDPACQQGDIDLGARNAEGRKRFRSQVRCAYQGHKLPQPDPQDVPAGWATLAQAAGHTLSEPDRYDLAFVEIRDNGREHAPDQLRTLHTALRDKDKAGQQNVVVTFVHGWRHDAGIRDGDIQKFRMVLGYTRAALNSRCIDSGAYCNASLTGVYLSWRGRSFAEPALGADGGMNPFGLGAFPTIWDRKDKSDALAKGPESTMSQVLATIQQPLSLSPGNPKADKMLVIGHSLGGNILASVMEGRAIKAIDRHSLPTPGADNARAMPPLLGDLVVLLNPASEAANWTSIQRRMRQRADLSDDQNQVAVGTDYPNNSFRQNLLRWQTMFPQNQRPIYISMTSTAKWHFIETRARTPRSDFATGTLFPLSRWAARYDGRENRKAVGHLTPRYSHSPSTVAIPTPEDAANLLYPREILTGPPVGASHEFSVNQGSGKKATYADSMIPDATWCSDASGWLYEARALKAAQNAQKRGRSTDGYWDYGLDETFKAVPNVARDHNPASIQWRHSLWLPGQKNRISVASSRSPFWNVRALDTALKEHHGWVSYPMWCAINQLVLDDVTARRTKSKTVMETIEAQKTFSEEIEDREN